MQGVGADVSNEQLGLPRSWMKAQWQLQTQILARARPLGIIGVLPAFQGNMPPQIQQLHPNANISISHTGAAPGYEELIGDGDGDGKFDSSYRKGDCANVASTDPLFGIVADAWMQQLLADFGTDHWYQCDGYFTGGRPPWLSQSPQAAAKVEARGGIPTGEMIKDVKPDPHWLPVWKAAWKGMARTDPKVVYTL